MVRKSQKDLEMNTVSIIESSDMGIRGRFCEAADKGLNHQGRRKLRQLRVAVEDEMPGFRNSLNMKGEGGSGVQFIQRSGTVERHTLRKC